MISVCEPSKCALVQFYVYYKKGQQYINKRVNETIILLNIIYNPRVYLVFLCCVQENRTDSHTFYFNLNPSKNVSLIEFLYMCD